MINNFISSRVGIDLIEIKNIFNFVTLVQWFFPSFFFHGKNLKVNEDKVSIIFLLFSWNPVLKYSSSIIKYLIIIKINGRRINTRFQYGNNVIATR